MKDDDAEAMIERCLRALKALGAERVLTSGDEPSKGAYAYLLLTSVSVIARYRRVKASAVLDGELANDMAWQMYSGFPGDYDFEDLLIDLIAELYAVLYQAAKVMPDNVFTPMRDHAGAIAALAAGSAHLRDYDLNQRRVAAQHLADAVERSQRATESTVDYTAPHTGGPR